MCWGGPWRFVTSSRIVQVVHRRDPPPERSALCAQRRDGAGGPCGPTWAIPGVAVQESSDLGVFAASALEPAGGRHGADPSPGSFASAPCPTPCRGTIA